MYAASSAEMLQRDRSPAGCVCAPSKLLSSPQRLQQQTQCPQLQAGGSREADRVQRNKWGFIYSAPALSARRLLASIDLGVSVCRLSAPWIPQGGVNAAARLHQAGERVLKSSCFSTSRLSPLQEPLKLAAQEGHWSRRLRSRGQSRQEEQQQPEGGKVGEEQGSLGPPGVLHALGLLFFFFPASSATTCKSAAAAGWWGEKLVPEKRLVVQFPLVADEDEPRADGEGPRLVSQSGSGSLFPEQS